MNKMLHVISFKIHQHHNHVLYSLYQTTELFLMISFRFHFSRVYTSSVSPTFIIESWTRLDDESGGRLLFFLNLISLNFQH
jgi:hypothetical protein